MVDQHTAALTHRNNKRVVSIVSTHVNYPGVLPYFLLLFAVLFAALLPTVAYAQETSNRGLGISPLRQEKEVAAGKPASGTFVVANNTNNVAEVSLTVQQFSVENATYNYLFKPVENDWVTLREQSISLQANQSKTIHYDISVPPKSAPGGYYYTMVASVQSTKQGLPTTLQAATLLYLTVDGELVRTSVMRNESLPFLVTGRDITYKFDIENTGNVHFSAYFYAQIDGVFGLVKQPQVGTSHLIMPKTTRSIEGSVQTPVLPGIYKVSYGYDVDFADFVNQRTGYILFIPPWSVAVVIVACLGGLWWRQKLKRRKQK